MPSPKAPPPPQLKSQGVEKRVAPPPIVPPPGVDKAPAPRVKVPAPSVEIPTTRPRMGSTQAGASRQSLNGAQAQRIVAIGSDFDRWQAIEHELREQAPGGAFEAYRDIDQLLVERIEIQEATVLLELAGLSDPTLALETLKRLRPTNIIVIATPGELGPVSASLAQGASDFVSSSESADIVAMKALTPKGAAEWSSNPLPRRIRLAPGLMLPDSPYRIEKLVGEGGMGVVYQAEHCEINRAVALKIIHQHLCRKKETVARFRQEAQATGKIGHPNVVDVLDFRGLPDGRQMLVMEFLDGTTLLDAGREGISLSRFFGIFRQVARGLAAAHLTNIVHRDVKLENVMLVEHQGQADFVKLVDFGIAGIIDDNTRERVAATPGYAPPEQLLGLEFDQRVDVYAMGVCMFEVLSGRSPFAGETAREVIKTQLDGPPPRVDAFAPEHVPEPLEDLVFKCMQLDADDRFADMLDLEAALCEAQVALGIWTDFDDLALPQVEPERKARLATAFAARRGSGLQLRWPLVLGLAGAVTLIGITALWFATRDTAATDAQESPVERLAQAARGAAAKALFVYPPPEAPDARTAYASVRELESLSTAEAPDEAVTATANELRQEFATALLVLGGRMWELPGGRAYARDYYAQALLFDPTDALALERAAMSPGIIADLGARATNLEFSATELRAAEALLALATEDEDERERRAQSVARLPGSVAAGARFATVLESIDPEVAARVELAQIEAIDLQAAADSATGSPTPPDEGDDSQDEGDEQDDDGELVEDPVKPDSPRDRAGARKLVERGKRALDAGKKNEAARLFHAALRLDHASVPALESMGDLEFNRSHLTTALRYRKRAVRLAPRSGRLQIKLGDSYFRLIRYADAERAYSKALSLGDPAAAGRLKKVRGRTGG